MVLQRIMNISLLKEKKMFKVIYEGKSVKIDDEKLDSWVKYFKNNRVAVHCDTEEKANAFLALLDYKKIRWCDNGFLIEANHWYTNKSDTCYLYDLHTPRGIVYCDLNYYINNHYEVIPFDEFLQEVKAPNYIHHIDGNCSNNNLDNLYEAWNKTNIEKWCTHATDVIAGEMKRYLESIAMEYEDIEPQEFQYHFKDDDINFKKICHDALEDDAPGWIVVGDDKAYVGLLRSGREVEIPVMPEDFSRYNNEFIRYVNHYPYGIFEIPRENIHTWMKKVKQYCKDYKEHRKDLDSKIKDRDRAKGNNTFKVIQYR